MSLRRYTWRAMQQRPGRTVLTMLSIVIGVTAAVAVGLGTATTRNAYKQMFAMVTGRATLEIDGKGGKSFPDDVLESVAQVPGVEAVAPLVERPTSLTMGEDRRLRVQILGIDPARDSQVRDYKIVTGRQVKLGSDELVLEQEFAKNLGLSVGDEVKLLTNYKSKPFEIVGVFTAASGAAFTQLSMAFLPIDRAQYYFNGRYVPKNAIDRIQVVTKADLDPDKVQPLVAAVLPEEVQVHRPAASTQLMRETLLSTEQGLQLTTLFSLLMAAFIILNTFLMNVSERRRHLSIMRAIGAVKGQITWMLLGESLLLGVIGTVIGIGMGVVLAFVGTYLVGRAFDVQLPRLVEVMTPWPFIQGAVFGLCMALAGAIFPALLASRISPLEGMNRIVFGKSADFTMLLLIVGAPLTTASLGLIFGCIYGYFLIDLATYAGVFLLIGLVLLNSVVLGPQAAFVASLIKPFARVETGLALKQVLRNPIRSALTMGVLFIAGSTGVGMANSILDCVRDVDEWYEQAITGDYFVRAMMPDMATGTAADLPEGLGEELAQVPHIGSLDGASFVEARVPQPGKDPGDALNVIVVARQYDDPKPPSFDLISGDRERLREQLRSGEVVVGSVLAQKLHLQRGDKLPLETKDGIKELPIAGIANEYMVGGMAVHMAREQGIKWLGVEGVDGYIIKAEEGHREELKPQLAAIAQKFDVLLLSHGEIRQNVQRIVSGTEWSLWLLVFMGFIVAAFGIVNTLTMNVLEQTRELGLLRIVAMTKKQVRRTIVTQALIIGGVGLPPGILLGVGIAYVLNLAMMPSFGHPITFHIHPRMLLGTLAGAVVIVLIAAIIPARRAASIDVVEALHYE